MLELSFLSYLIFATNIGVLSIYITMKQDKNEKKSEINLDFS